MIKNEPGRSIGTSMGPRVIIDFDDMPSTAPGSFRSRAHHVILPARRTKPPTRWSRLRNDFRDDFVSARSFRATD